ncbi:MAG: GNAT family N-acetyltransferase [Anaerolineales bacterium]|nr:GNAT family N-acetyltransferase [Anaerolineales bacterium]
MSPINNLLPNTTQTAIYTRPVRRVDYERIQALLQLSLPITPLGLNWDIRRWEGKCWYDPHENGNPDWHKNCQLWETSVGQLVGLVHSDSLGFPYLEIHPDYRYLEVEMIAWAEGHLAEPQADQKGQQLQFFVYEYDVHRQHLLAERGYEKMAYGGVIRHMRLGRQPLERPQLPNGYTLRATNPENEDDAQQIADLLNAAFNRTFHNAQEYQQFTRQATCFRAELDLVAVAADGRFAAYVGVPYDPVNKRGLFEPVCTHPDHRQKGLAKALMQEGLQRLRGLDAIDVVVETGDMVPANRLYTRMGFTEMYKGNYWLLKTNLVESEQF